MKGKRILSAVLSAALLLQLSPLVAFAEDTTPLPDTISTVQSEPAPELLAEPTPEPTVEPATALPPEPEAEPTATPTPNPTAEPTATPAAETPAPDATAEPTAEPTATPDPAAEVQALINALPDADAVTADTADAVEEQLAAIDDAKDTLTDEQLAGLDFARYDAAANALLALWGEAPTDEVETLDATYTAPNKEGEWYVIDDANDLYWLATTAPKNVKAKLTENITVNRNVLGANGNPTGTSFTAWTPIGTDTDPFTGTLDGNGHTISGLYCNTPSNNYVGLFGSIARGGTVTHLGVVDSYFAGSTYVGGVCGYNQGTISGCYSTATVNSTASGGVMVGYSAGKVENSFAYGHAQGKASPFSVSDAASGERNCFYLSLQKDTSILGKTGATVDQFKSGEVAYQLSNGGSSKEPIWKQVLNKDPYPSFEGQAVGKADNGTYHNHENAGNCPVCGNVGKPGNDGNGSYLITTEEKFKWFAAQVNIAQNSSAKAVLANDITVTSWTPIGNATNKFNGTLDGNGHTVTIDSMANNSADYAGLVGYLGNFGTVRNIKVAGKVSGGNNVGGVVGYCLGELQNVMNAANVRGTSNVGGVVGYMGSTKSSYNLGNTGEITGSSVGGLVGTMAGGGYVNNGFSTTRGVCGTLQSGTFNNCYDTTMKNLSAFESGEVAYLLHQPSSGSTWGQNLDGKAKETAPNCLNNSPQVFQNKDKDGYHNHTGETCDKCPTVPPQENGVYQISTEQQLRDYARIVNTENRTASAVLKADITVSGEWTPIGGSDVYFQGTFDGQNYSITFKQPVTSTSNYVGLFARTESGAKIQKLTVQGKFSSGNTVGGIVGLNKGTITNCKLQNSTVTNTGSNTTARTGGLVGSNYGTIENSQVVSSTVSGSSVYMGGLAGFNNEGTIQNCRVILSNVTAAAGGNAGGLAGRNSAGVIKDSYAAVDLPVAKNYNGGTTTNCYRLGATASVNGGETTATEQQFHSGEVAYKLAEGSKSAPPQWGQTIAPDSYPVLGGDTVYCVEDYYHNHNGSCAACGDTGRPDKAGDTYHIASYENLLWFAKLVNGTLMQGMPAKPEANAVLTADITVDTVDNSWPGIGADDKSYGGSFNGNGNTVTLTGAKAANQMLFGTTSGTAKLKAICVMGGCLSNADSAVVTSCYRPESYPLFQNKTAGSAANCYTLGKLAENAASSAKFTKCYQVDSTTSVTGITSKDNTAFTSGEVAYNLATGDSKWGQKLKVPDANQYPIYGGKTVYFNNTDGYHNHGDTECEHCNYTPKTEEKDGKTWYIIKTPDDLQWFANWVNKGNTTANAKLANDITLNTKLLDANGNPTGGTHDSWTPIGGNSSANCYKGTFDGYGYTISGLYCDVSNKSYVGLFACVGAGGTVKNVNIADSYVSGSENIGLLCGANGGTRYNGGTIVNCTVSGTVKGSHLIGGVCGRNILGTVQNCTSNAAVTGTGKYVGGICGENQGGTVTGCTNTGTVSGNQVVGGICGYNYPKSDTKAQIISCTNTGTVMGTSDSVGGVCGMNSGGTVTECTNNGAVSGGSYVGGICGKNSNTYNSNSVLYSAEISSCKNTGNVKGEGDNTGGICGYNHISSVQGCRNTGNVKGERDNTGGICGYNLNGSVQGCHNTGDVTGTGKYVGGVCGYNPYNKYAADGQYNTIQKCDNSGTVTGTGGYTGGVCGRNDKSRTLQECYNTGAVSGTGDYTGGVCGWNSGTVQECYNTSTVTGTGDYTGGVCGYNSDTVKGCYNTGDVSGTKNVGGVCGYNEATVENCYYLVGTSDKAVGGGNDGTNCASKTETEFRNGAVAYLLQAALGAGADQVWGQRIDADGTGETDKTPVLSSDSTYAVHPAKEGSLCKRYSNMSGQTFNEHEYDDKTRVCSRCGESKPPEEVDGYYEIYNQGQLRLFAELVNNTPSDSETKLNARLMKDIAMDGTEWTPIGTNAKPFTGTFDGNGNTITGLTCTDTSAYYVGLVGYASGATIQNVTVKESAFNGYSYIGAVCGRIVNGTITNCHAVKTTIGELGRNNYPQYCGGIVGEPAVRDDGTCVVTDCTNSGTVSGRFDLGGIAGQVDHATVQRCFNTGIVTGSNSEIGGIAGRVAYATVQRCFNSGAVTGGWPSIGGIAGKADGATVQDCGNTGAVKRTNNSNECGGIVGKGQFGGSIQNCYNAVSNMAYPIFFKYDGAVPSLSNCYYLADNPGTDPTAKTAAQFASGEVAYLLQGERTDTTTVWGQTLTEPNKQDFPVPGGEKVYQSAPCKIEYTNTESKTVEHNFDNGYCKNCGQPQIAYTVTIPASVELGNTATITATGVTLPDNKQLNVKVADNSPFKVALGDDTREYTVTIGETPVNPGNTVLTAEGNVDEKTVALQFNKPATTTYSGTYTGTVTFTVSVDDKAS